MRTSGASQLDIKPETDTQAMRVKVVLLGLHPDEHGDSPMLVRMHGP